MVVESLRLTATFVALWMLPVCLAALVFLWGGSASRKTRRTVRETGWVLIACYFFAAIAVNLWPFDFDPSLARVIERGNFTPLNGSLNFLVTRIGEGDYLRHDFLHLVLLAPIGFLLPLQQRRTSRLWVVAFWAIFIVGLALVLEVVQGISVAERGFDVDDAIGGAVGGFAAVVAGATLKLIVDASRRSARRERPHEFLPSID